MRSAVALSLLFVLSPNAMAYSPWIVSHEKCHEAFQTKGPKPSPHVTNYQAFSRSETNDVKSKWGEHVMAFPGTNGSRAGLWLMSKGQSYFSELPRAKTTHYAQGLLPPQNEWHFIAEAPDRPELQIIVRRNASPESVTSINLHAPFTGHERSTQTVRFTQETPADLEQQSADILLKWVNHNIKLGGNIGGTREALTTCFNALDVNKEINRPLLEAMRTLFTSPNRQEPRLRPQFDSYRLFPELEDGGALR